MRDAVAGEHLLRQVECRGDTRPRGEALRPWIRGELRLALARGLLRLEQPQHRLELPRGRPGREHLVRHVGEHHEAERAAGRDQAPKGRADRRVVLRADAEREVDDRDAGRSRQPVRPPGIEATRRCRGADEQGQRGDDEHDSDEARAEPRAAHRAHVVAVDRGAARQQAHRPPPSFRTLRAPSARARSSPRSWARAVTRQGRVRSGRGRRHRGRRARRRRARARGAGRRSR